MSDDETPNSATSSDSENLATTGLIATRAKRSTAGNLYASLRANLDDEELQKELLAEDADDVGDYQQSDREDDEAAFDSSSDDEDQGPTQPGDAEDLAGEKELKKAERAEASKKRKAQDARLKLPSWQKKRVKLADDVKTGDDVPERPKKKSERPSWMPLDVEAPLRQSGRALARANREVTHAHMRKSYERSEKQRKVMKNAAEREKATKRANLTPEERMLKVMKIEKETKKEFGRWEREEAERQRIRDELLAAKRKKGLDGPFIRYWSGSAMWEGDSIKVKRVVSEKKPANDEEVKIAGEAAVTAEENKDSALARPPEDSTATEKDATVEVEKTAVVKRPPDEHTKMEGVETTSMTLEPVKGNAGTQDSKMTVPPSSEPMDLDTTANAPLGQEKDPQDPKEEAQSENAPAATTAPLSLHKAPENNPPAPAPVPWLAGIEEYATMPAPESVQQPVSTQQVFYMPSSPILHCLPPLRPIDPPPPLPREQAQRCLVMLEQFQNLGGPTITKRSRLANTLEPKDIATIIMPNAYPQFSAEQAKYLTAKALKKRGGDLPAKRRCAITSWVAKYRDPHTGLAYADLHTYKIIQRLLSGGCQWSSVLGAWVGPVYGSMGRPAAGVPEGFVDLGSIAAKPDVAVKTEDGTRAAPPEPAQTDAAPPESVSVAPVQVEATPAGSAQPGQS